MQRHPFPVPPTPGFPHLVFIWLLFRWQQDIDLAQGNFAAASQRLADATAQLDQAADAPDHNRAQGAYNEAFQHEKVCAQVFFSTSAELYQLRLWERL